jgi:hypothetical protein
MSVFKVKLTNVNQGLLDTNGQSSGTSVQRGVYVMGPNKVNRLLIDGSTFTDSNYWKRYAVPAVTNEFAIVETVTDDGSVWVDNPPNARVFPVVSTFSVANAVSTYLEANTIDYLATYGSRATYVQISTVTSSCVCRINGLAEITISTSVAQIFNPGDLDITKLEFKNPSGGGTAAITVLASVRSVENT